MKVSAIKPHSLARTTIESPSLTSTKFSIDQLAIINCLLISDTFPYKINVIYILQLTYKDISRLPLLSIYLTFSSIFLAFILTTTDFQTPFNADHPNR